MRWLAAGLTFVNVATVSALFLGMVGGGMGRRIAFVASFFGTAAAILAWLQMNAAESRQEASKETPGLTINRLWFWLLAFAFGFFAFRSFCWLFFLDGNNLKVQSINNLGDLSLHITYVRNFASGVPLWPENPIHAFSHIRYPAGTDLFNAVLLLLGLDLTKGFVWTGLLGAAAAFYALYRWGGAFTVAGFLFNGGIEGLKFLNTWKVSDYQGLPTVAWKSLALSMLVTQRGLLYALPAGLLLLYHWRAKYFAVAAGDDPGRSERDRAQPLPFWVELLLYATMPLFHLHTFMALSIVAAFLFLMGEAGTRRQLGLLVGAAFLPATFFVWTITDHFQARSLLQWSPGWVQPPGPGNQMGDPFFEFWFRNFGLWPVLVLALIGFCVWRATKAEPFRVRDHPALAFLAPAALLFLLACLVKAAPWEWDNIKLIIWAYLIMLPFLWSELISRWMWPVRVAVCIALFTSGAVSLLGGLIGKENGYGVGDRAEVDGVGAAVRRLPPTARFAAHPTYNHPLLLQGRQVVLGYPGHLWTQGFDYGDMNTRLEKLLRGAPDWREQARHLRARYLFWGREEKSHYGTSTRPWEQQTALVASGTWGAIYDLESAPFPPGASPTPAR